MTTGGEVYKLLNAMYGLRDAGAAFDGKALDVVNLMGVSLGKFSICVGYGKVMDTLVRLVALGRRHLLEWTEIDLQRIPR